MLFIYNDLSIPWKPRFWQKCLATLPSCWIKFSIFYLYRFRIESGMTGGKEWRCFVILGLDPGVHEIFPSSSRKSGDPWDFSVILGLGPGIHELGMWIPDRSREWLEGQKCCHLSIPWKPRLLQKCKDKRVRFAKMTILVTFEKVTRKKRDKVLYLFFNIFLT